MLKDTKDLPVVSEAFFLSSIPVAGLGAVFAGWMWHRQHEDRFGLANQAYNEFVLGSAIQIVYGVIFLALLI